MQAFGRHFSCDILRSMKMLMSFDLVILNLSIHSEEIIQNKERNLYIDVCGSIIYNSKKLEAS